MTGLPEFNYPAFHAAADQLRARGYKILNPAENKPAQDSPTWADWMRLALAQVLAADGLAMLPGWENSRGAQVESFVARALGLEVRPLSDWLVTV
jgi:hypothetical protein